MDSLTFNHLLDRIQEKNRHKGKLSERSRDMMKEGHKDWEQMQRNKGGLRRDG